MSALKPDASRPKVMPTGFLEAIRAVAALWVVLVHTSILSRGPKVFSETGMLAVDIFMLMSGFLMMFHYIKRRDAEPWGSPRTWLIYYLRRFFRIAPLYYLALAAAYVLAHRMGQDRLAVAHVFPSALASPDIMRRYDIPDLPQNVFMHVSLLFGFTPRYAYSTPLPDWAVGLEWSFYLVFPFAALLMLRLGALVGLGLLLGACHAMNAAGWFDAFPMPAVVAMKAYCFGAGMFLALFLNPGPFRIPRFVSAAAALASAWGAAKVPYDNHAVLLVLTAFCLAMLAPWKPGGAPAAARDAINRAMSLRLWTWQAELSYSVYLTQLLFILPLAGWLILQPWYRDQGDAARFLMLTAAAAVPTYLSSWLLLHLVEKPGIELGRKAIERLAGPRRVQPLEKPAA